MRIRDAVVRDKEMGLNSLMRKEVYPDEVHSKSFSGVMRDTQERLIEQELLLLMEEIKLQEEKLIKHLTLAEVIRYRKLVSRFLSTVVSNMYQFTKHDYFNSQGRHEVYAVVNKVNQKLEELVKQVLHSDRDKLKILSLVDDIRGLLIDLFY
ncbi:YaaR family protein [Caldicoprobacter faecalis]|uniref:DUF327 domain-containing protein n=1 Tax=Caldicoprobacter faecalis TaxID=937334 RepID=A0A1I5W134_9FIRM|nr:YaaR family protein [Caldicoprobacter faecalis]SFQ13468.1 hypothetical protein SAMN05444406_11363 [Caldicoprobacter faecalis]